MAKKRSWTDEQLIEAVRVSKSYRNVLILLGLVPAGGNYDQIKQSILRLGLDISHFTGMGWNAALAFRPVPPKPLNELLVRNGTSQSFVLKKRLFIAGIKEPKCELCGWSEMSADGRIPVELDHINGDRSNNTRENLRALCPNCHSQTPTFGSRSAGVDARERIIEAAKRGAATTHAVRKKSKTQQEDDAFYHALK